MQHSDTLLQDEVKRKRAMGEGAGSIVRQATTSRGAVMPAAGDAAKRDSASASVKHPRRAGELAIADTGPSREPAAARNAAAAMASINSSSPPQPVFAASSSPRKHSREQQLLGTIDNETLRMLAPASQLPPLAVGQGLVWVGDAHNSRVEYRITGVNAEGVTLAAVRGDSHLTHLSRGDLAAMLNDPARGLEVRERADIQSARVPTVAEEAYERIAQAQNELTQLELRHRLGPKNYTVAMTLLRHRAELAYDRAAATGSLRQWLDTNGGYTSASRLLLGLTMAGVPGFNFKRVATDPELYSKAPDRDTVARLDRALDAVDKALSWLMSSKASSPSRATLLNVDVGADPVLTQMAAFAASNKTDIEARDVIGVRLAFLREAVSANPMRVGDAWVAYHATVQPYLHLKAANGDSFHYLADGSASLTLAINQAIQQGTLKPAHKLALSSHDLIALRPQIVDHWAEVAAQHDTLRHRDSIASPDWRPPFDAAAFDAEVARLQAIEREPKHAELRAVLEQNNVNAIADTILAAEPSFVKRFGAGTLKVLDSTEFWAMIAVGALTAGAASGAVLGDAAVSTAELVNLARAGTLSMRAVGLFAASTAIDGAAFQTGMNAFNILIGKSERVDFSAAGYARSIALMGISQLAAARHALRSARLAPGVMRYAGEATRYFVEEAAGMGLVASGETLLRQGNLDGAFASLEQSLQFLVAMRLANGLQSAVGINAKPEQKKLDELERAVQRAEADYGKDPSASKLEAAFVAFRQYVAQLELVNARAFARGLATQREVALTARTDVVSGAEFVKLVAAAKADISRLGLAPAEVQSLAERYDAIAARGEAFFDPLTGRTYVCEGVLGQPDAARVVAGQWVHQSFHALPASVRAVVVEAFTTHTNWATLRAAFLHDHPWAQTLGNERLVNEILVHLHEQGLSSGELASLAQPILASAAVRDAGLNKTPVVDLDALASKRKLEGGRYAQRSDEPGLLGRAVSRADIVNARHTLARISPSAAERAHAMAVLEIAARDPNATIVSETDLGGGINTTKRVVLSNGLEAVWKPSAGEYQDQVRDHLAAGHQAQREAASYLVDKAMGHLAGVPPTVYRSFAGESGALVVFVDARSSSAPGSQLLPEQMLRGAVFDQVVGNLDRHGGNYLVTSDGGLVPIDHGLVLPLRNGPQGFANVDFEAVAHLEPTHRQAVEALVKQRSLMTKQLLDLGIESEAINAMFERVQQLLQRGETGAYWRDDGNDIGAPVAQADATTQSMKPPSTDKEGGPP